MAEEDNRGVPCTGRAPVKNPCTARVNVLSHRIRHGTVRHRIRRRMAAVSCCNVPCRAGPDPV